MLIRNAMLMTMTEQGTFRGDLRIADGLIREVAQHIQGTEETEKDGSGLWVMPGMIDLHISCREDEPVDAAALAWEAGVTAGLMSEGDGLRCWRFAGRSMEPSPFLLTDASRRSAEQLAERIIAASSAGLTCACEIHSAEEMRSVLSASAQTDKRVLLTDLYGCDMLAEEIAASGCPLVTGVGRNRSGSWRLAARVDALGGMVAVSCRYPLSQFRFLPDCASLCVREGMPPERALMGITANPASFLGLTDAGRIAPGCRANLALFDGDPLLLASSLTAVILQGKMVRMRHTASGC